MRTPGWNLTEGTITFSRQSEADVIRLVNLALSPAKKHTTTYKYAFFQGGARQSFQRRFADLFSELRHNRHELHGNLLESRAEIPPEADAVF